ncbi:hypothetical protein DXA36_04305 [Eisenbergiella sp. OF01-20]|nr:hypothetical protein DXA36_04305 [Eisenbergiella sp. OF01-20]
MRGLYGTRAIIKDETTSSRWEGSFSVASCKKGKDFEKTAPPFADGTLTENCLSRYLPIIEAISRQ